MPIGVVVPRDESEVCIALQIVREFLLGLPMLIFLHHLESRRWLAQRPETAIN
jgi:hypothetical protein